MKSNKEKLIELIDYIGEEKCGYIHDVISTFHTDMLSKGDIMRLAYTDRENGKIDSAIPITRTRNIQEVHPEFKTHFHAYSYVDNNFGKMVNVAEDFVTKFNKILID